MTFLLDTCVISELVKPRQDENVVRWIDSIDERKLFLSVLTLGELVVTRNVADFERCAITIFNPWSA